MKNRRALLASCGAATMIIATTLLPSWNGVSADGTETLGPPSIAIAEGSGVIVAGVGLEAVQTGTINLDVPAGSTVKQVLLYWEGQTRDDVAGDETATVNGAPVTGMLIGGRTLFFRNAYSSTYRADITALGAVVAGSNAVEIGGLSFSKVTNGAGLAVIYDDGTKTDIQIVDGNDLAFINFDPPLDTTVEQTFTFEPADVDRVASVSLFFSSVTGPISGGGDIRPSTIRATSGGIVTEANNLLDSNNGDEWDSDNFPDVNVPAGATELTLQVLSEDAFGDGVDPLPASFAWNAATLALPSVVTLPAPTIPPPVTTIPPPVTTIPPPVTTLPPQVTTLPPPVTTLPPTGILPETGPSSTRLPLGAGLIALLGGLALVSLARRRPSTN